MRLGDEARTDLIELRFQTFNYPSPAALVRARVPDDRGRERTPDQPDSGRGPGQRAKTLVRRPYPALTEGANDRPPA
ncbi:hypothetical protein SAMN05442782_1596 [Streptomyces sp. OK228]|nr:hypothetical protein SAMN05442782_1596 [Streptomyces sp. OK228]